MKHVRADLSSVAGAQAGADAVLGELGGLDVLVNNAGGGSTTFVEGTAAIPDEHWQRELDFSYLSAVRLTSRLTPALAADGGDSSTPRTSSGRRRPWSRSSPRSRPDCPTTAGR
ncbi:SDR family NAD(P)-dependent oxidoreductase [Streptomyces sp. NPDC050619]|uniref:SDR family NAD(P)-dependent oxidoreductase n=1 Tax=Streptomyces sp. NPDC050619 TaxID=3157214 RepID=UPI0034314AE0